MDAFEILKARGFVEQTTGEEAVRDLLASGPVSFYCGFDPTATSFHAGSLVPIMAMAWLQRAGHHAIALVGGGTAMVGDPSGRDETRQLITRETIATHVAGISAQLRHYLDLTGERGQLVDNADWLLEFNYISFLREIGRHFSVNRMLAAEAYKQRLEKGLSFIEFNYQLLQATDFLELYRRHDCKLQIGGNDQWGNILAGTELVRRMEGADVQALTFPLLTTSTGAKMGKTLGGAVWLDRERLSPFDYFQYWVSCDDRDVDRFLKIFTFLPLERIEELGKLQGADIREAKRVLAFEATAITHGREAAEAADQAARAMVSGKAAADMPTHAVSSDELAAGIKVYVALSAGGLTKSNGEGRRLIKGGGVKLNGEKIKDAEYSLVPSDLEGDGSLVLRVGKKRALRIVVA